MFLRSEKYSQSTNYNPPVGHYDVMSRFESPVTDFSQKSITTVRRRPVLCAEPERAPVSGPLNDYAKPIARVRQNRKHIEVTRRVPFVLPTYEIEKKPSPPKGRLLRPSKESYPKFVPNACELFLGSETSSQKQILSQHRKSPPKQLSPDSLELMILRQKQQKAPSMPGPGTYNINLINRPHVLEFSKCMGRDQGINNSLEIGVGDYHLPSINQARSIMKFDRYAKKASVFDTKVEHPTFYDSMEMSMRKQPDLPYPIAFGVSSKR